MNLRLFLHNRLRVWAVGVAGARRVVKEDRLGHDMAYSSGIHVHNPWLRETSIQELVSRHVSHVHHMDRIAQLRGSVDDHYNWWVSVVLIWDLTL